MPNYFNIMGGLLTFVACSAMAFFLWNPMTILLAYFPNELYIICATTWLSMCFVGIVYAPFIMFVSDDNG